MSNPVDVNVMYNIPTFAKGDEVKVEEDAHLPKCLTCSMILKNEDITNSVCHKCGKHHYLCGTHRSLRYDGIRTLVESRVVYLMAKRGFLNSEELKELKEFITEDMANDFADANESSSIDWKWPALHCPDRLSHSTRTQLKLIDEWESKLDLLFRDGILDDGKGWFLLNLCEPCINEEMTTRWAHSFVNYEETLKHPVLDVRWMIYKAWGYNSQNIHNHFDVATKTGKSQSAPPLTAHAKGNLDIFYKNRNKKQKVG